MLQYLVTTRYAMGYMAYTTNPHLPRLRMEAVRLVEQGWGIREVARHFHYSHGAVLNWVKKANRMQHHLHAIPTRSSRPHHPRTVPAEIVEKILTYRRKFRRCSLVLKFLMERDGIVVSRSSIERTIRRHHLSRWGRQKRRHVYPPRPAAQKPGILVQIDTIHDGVPSVQLCMYTLLDVCSRWAHALPTLHTTTGESIRFLDKARTASPFPFQTLQSDHGSEFSKRFTTRMLARGMSHRHSRIRTPNDNAHLERFNRTIQEECIERLPRNLRVWRKEVPEYLKWYNEKRPHLGLAMRSPMDVVRSS